MRLEELIQDSGVTELHGDAQTEIVFVTNDSRKVVPGCLFVAVNGCGKDGRAYIAPAIKAGAVAVMLEKPQSGEDAGLNCPEIPEGISTVYVADSRRAVAVVADRYYGHPSGKLQLIGVTGTNGKTTVATLLYRLFNSLGYRCGLLSTIANYCDSLRIETANTTSDPMTINSLLARMVEAGCTHCFMEVSSIGLHQHKTDALSFRLGIFTNLTHDHLDYHGSFAEYLRCKQSFFDALPKDAVAITNVDDRNGMIMVQNTRAKLVTCSCRRPADHSCRIMEESFEGMLLNLDGTELWTRLIGTHNASNILSVYSAALALGMDRQRVLVTISALKPVSGRLETIAGPRGIRAVIDYAHTPDALENVLRTLRDVGQRRQLYCLFGCGGDRDRTKRPEMGAIAAKYADRIFITSDNSRSESTEQIMEEIRSGIPEDARAKTVAISDRREAIRSALLLAPADTTVLLAGKGHETYQITGKDKLHFDEREIVEETFKTMHQ